MLHLGFFSGDLCLAISLNIDWPFITTPPPPPPSMRRKHHIRFPQSILSYQMDATHAPAFFPLLPVGRPKAKELCQGTKAGNEKIKYKIIKNNLRAHYESHVKMAQGWWEAKRWLEREEDVEAPAGIRQQSKNMASIWQWNEGWVKYKA